MATEIKSRDDLKLWLKGRPVADARVIASRAALRVLPVESLYAFDPFHKGFNFTELNATFFRACSSASVAAKISSRIDELYLATLVAANASASVASTSAPGLGAVGLAVVDAAYAFDGSASGGPAAYAALMLSHQTPVKSVGVALQM
jgi:hypothetical protein